METLAEALDCPLCELVGEPAVIEYRGLGDWPAALQDVLAERGGFVTVAERAFLEDRLETIVPDPLRVAQGCPEVQDDPQYWRSQLKLFRDSRVWRIVENLVTDGWRLDHDVQVGLDLIVRATIGRIGEEEASR